MWTLEKLEQHFGKSQHQLYRRIRAADPLIDPHLQRLNKNAIALDEGGFRILEGIIESEKQGKTLTNSVADLEKDLSPRRDDRPTRTQPDDIDHHPNGGTEARDRALFEELGYLKGQLELKNAQVDDLKRECDLLREENVQLKRQVSLVEYHQAKRWWQFWR